MVNFICASNAIQWIVNSIFKLFYLYLLIIMKKIFGKKKCLY